MTPSRFVKYAQRQSVYLFQRLTGYGIDEAFAHELSEQASAYLKGQADVRRPSLSIPRATRSDLNLDDTSRYTLVRDDIYRRFDANQAGSEIDRFGRRGQWIPRGSKIYFDTETKDFVKVFDEHFCTRGRSEEHTSELQSRENLVCRLLLEKK